MPPERIQTLLEPAQIIFYFLKHALLAPCIQVVPIYQGDTQVNIGSCRTEDSPDRALHNDRIIGINYRDIFIISSFKKRFKIGKNDALLTFYII